MSTYNYNSYGTPSPGPGPGNTGPNRNSGGNDDIIDTISWIVDVGMIFIWFPVGLFLTIANARGHNFVGSIIRAVRKSLRGESGGASNVRVKTGFDVGQNRTTSSRVYGTQGQTTSSRVGQTYTTPDQTQREADARSETAQVEEEPTKKNDGVRRADAKARLMEIAGWIVGVVGFLSTVGSVGDGLWSVLSGLAILAGGGALVWSARKAKKKEAAFKRCITVSGNTGIVKLDGLAKTLGLEEEELEKQLLEMIDRGYYGEKAYIDHARGLLVIEPSDMRDVYKAEDEARATRKTAEARSAMSEYDKIIEQIHQADVDIEDEAMSEKIRTMQEITAAIFAEVEANPEKKPQIQRFMNYYLPTTLKLLDAYARIESQGVSGENMAKSKAEIERIADTLVEGYRKQLDTLYSADVVDITGDVNVIESMMRRDGLTGHNDFTIHVPSEEGSAGTAGGAAEGGAAQAGGQVLGGH